MHTLAELYQSVADVEIIWTHFPNWGKEIWPPLRGSAIPRHTFVAADQSKFIQQALELVAVHPCDVLHLSKPRFPNILMGLLYKLVWNPVVLMDIDDEELAFVQVKESLNLTKVIEKQGRLPEFTDLHKAEWTRLAVGLAAAFDGVTTANAPLQKRYGGQIVRHARDEKRFAPPP